MLTASRSMSGITPRTATRTDEFGSCLPDPVKKLCSGPSAETPSLCGDDSRMTASTRALESDSKASTAPRSGKRERIAARTLFVKRMQSLIASGLIGGITPTSTRKGSNQGYLGPVFSARAGDTSGFRVDDGEHKAG